MSQNISITQPKRLPGEVPWDPSHHYDCSNGHHIKSDKPVAQCPAFRRGTVCDGSLTRVGPGGGKLKGGKA